MLRDSGIWEIFAGEIRNPGLWNPEYSSEKLELGIGSATDKQLGIHSTWNLESMAWDPEYKTLLDFLTWDEWNKQI